MRVLVTGVGGLIGSNVAAAAAQQSWEAIGCYRGQAMELDGVQTIAVDLAERNRCVAAAMEFDPDVIVHAAGGVALSRFELEPRLAELDYLATEHTIAAARAVRARYVLVSCDWVYSGYRPAGSRFAESDAAAPVNAYGRSKLACEQATMHANLPWLILRPADVYGVNLSRPKHRDPQQQGAWELGLEERVRGSKTLGDKALGDKALGDKALGDKTQGDKTQGDKTQGDKTQGDKTQEDKTQEDKTQEDKTQEDKTQEDKTQEDKTQEDKTQGNRARRNRAGRNKACGSARGRR